MHIFVYPLVLLYIVFRKYLDCLRLDRGLKFRLRGSAIVRILQPTFYKKSKSQLNEISFRRRSTKAMSQYPTQPSYFRDVANLKATSLSAAASYAQFLNGIPAAKNPFFLLCPVAVGF